MYTYFSFYSLPLPPSLSLPLLLPPPLPPPLSLTSWDDVLVGAPIYRSVNREPGRVAVYKNLRNVSERERERERYYYLTLFILILRVVLHIQHHCWVGLMVDGSVCQ